MNKIIFFSTANKRAKDCLFRKLWEKKKNTKITYCQSRQEEEAGEMDQGGRFSEQAWGWFFRSLVPVSNLSIWPESAILT